MYITYQGPEQMAKKLEMKKGLADCYKSAKLSPTPPFASIWS